MPDQYPFLFAFFFYFVAWDLYCRKCKILFLKFLCAFISLNCKVKLMEKWVLKILFKLCYEIIMKRRKDILVWLNSQTAFLEWSCTEISNEDSNRWVESNHIHNVWYLYAIIIIWISWILYLIHKVWSTRHYGHN